MRKPSLKSRSSGLSKKVVFFLGLFLILALFMLNNKLSVNIEQVEYSLEYGQ